MQFNEVTGREDVKTHLRELVEQNRLSHALLFLGKEGSGALRMTLAFAQFILCERVQAGLKPDRTPTLFSSEPEPVAGNVLRTDSCGVCTACLKAEQNIHPDLHFSYPVLKRNSNHTRVLSTDYINEWREFLIEQPYGTISDWLNFLVESPTAKIESAANKQGNISAQECEDIIRKLSLRPFESDFKILIMWMPEFLGKEGNRLLKLIEEPPDGTIFIFVAEDESQILPTILSRTQLLKIPLPEDVEVEKYLSTKSQDERLIKQAAAVAGGNLREALKALSGYEEDRQKIIRDWLNAIYRNKVTEQTGWIEEVNQSGKEKQKQLLLYFLHLINISVRLEFMDEKSMSILDEGEVEFGRTMNKICDISVMEKMTDELNNALYYLERNANSKLLFHALTIRFYHLIKKKQLILIN